MSQSAPDLRSSHKIFRRNGILVGAAVTASLLAGIATAAYSPAMVTSTALVQLPVTTLTSAGAAAIANSAPVLVGALPQLSPGTSLATVQNEVQVKSLTPYVLSVSARAGSAAQAEATANAVAESYLGYAGSAGDPAGHMPAIILQSATSASGSAGLMRLLVGAMLGLVSGVLIGVVAALAKRRLA
jgi:capsular polysaccharide biosynthesis protein